MRKTQTITIDVNAPRRKTVLAEIREAIETRTQDSLPPTSIGTGTGLDYCLDFLPIGDVYRIDLDDILDDLGKKVGEVDNGEVVLYDSNDQNPILLALAARVTSTSFTLPTDAQYIVDVWFDGLHADPEAMWQFTPDTSITTTAPLPADMLVQTMYVGIVD